METKTERNGAKSRKDWRKNGKFDSSKANNKSNRSSSRNRSNSAKEQFDKAQDYAKANFTSNDPAWYSTDAALARDAASIPFSWATGTQSDIGFNLPIHNKGTAAFAAGKFVAPGLLTLYLRPSVGFATKPTDPINIAATAVYSYVRHANSGSANYDAPDLMCYIMAMGEIVSFTNFLGRAYGIISQYATRNRYLPDAVITAMGLDPSDLRSNLAQFRYGLNLALNKISSLAVPTTFTYLKRKAQVFNEVYIEGSSSKDQMYMLVPHSVLKFGHDNEGASALDPVQWKSSTPKTVAQTLAFLNDLIDPMIMDEDINIMSGDILKAYGTAGILKFARIPEDYMAIIKFDIGMLEQIKNAFIFPPAARMKGAVTQDESKGFLISDETITMPVPSDSTYSMQMQANWELTAENRILTTTTDAVGPDLVLENTRLMTPVVQTGRFTFEIHAASEVVVAASVATFTGIGGPDLTFYDFQTDISITATQPIAGTTSLLTQAALSAFKFAPAVMFVGVAPDGENLPYSIGAWRFIGYDNYAVLTPEDLQRMNEAALLNMLHVPSIGSVFS